MATGTPSSDDQPLDPDDGAMPGLVVEPETLPDGRSITYFSAPER